MSRSNRRGEATRRLVLDAAQRHFLTHGFAGTRIERVAADAQVATGTVYVHFRNKQGLYSAVLLRAERMLLDEYLAPAFDLPVPPWERIRAWCRAYMRFAVEHRDLARLMAVIEWSEATWLPEVERQIREQIAAGRARLVAIFEEAAELGQLGGVAPAAAAHFVWWSMYGVAAQNVRHPQYQLEPDALMGLVESGVSMLSGGRTPAGPDQIDA